MIASIFLERELLINDSQTAEPRLDPAALVLLPVRTTRGGFAWISSDKRLRQVLEPLLTPAEFSEAITSIEETLCRADAAATTRCGVVHSQNGKSDQLILEQFAFSAERHLMVDRIAEAIARQFLPSAYEFSWWQDKAAHDLVVLREEVLSRLIIALEGPGFADGIRRNSRLPGDSLLCMPAEKFQTLDAQESGEGMIVFSNERRPPTCAHLRSVKPFALPVVAERQPRRRRDGEKNKKAEGAAESADVDANAITNDTVGAVEQASESV